MKSSSFFVLFIFFIPYISHAQQTGWSAVSAPAFCNNTWGEGGSLHLISNDTVYVIKRAGCFYKTSDGGQNWLGYTMPSNDNYDMDFLDANYGMVVGNNGKIIKTIDSGNNWTILNTGTSKKLNAIEIIDQNTAWVVGDTATILHTTDAGFTWQHIPINSTSNIYDIKFQTEQTGYMVGAKGLLLKTIDGGNNWNPINLNTNDDFFALSIKGGHIRFLKGAYDYYSRHANDYYDSSDGITWANIPIYGQYGAGDMDFADSNTGFIVESACATCNCNFLDVVKTVDNGMNWNTSLNLSGDSNIGVSCSNLNDIKVYDENTIYILSGMVIYKTTDGGTYTEIIVGIEEDKQPTFTIFPNPAANQVNISAEKIFNQVIIMDLFGNIILQNKNNSTSLILDISDLSKGIYFVKIIGKKYNSIRKLLVL